jgi:hypothetical protein
MMFAASLSRRGVSEGGVSWWKTCDSQESPLLSLSLTGGSGGSELSIGVTALKISLIAALKPRGATGMKPCAVRPVV